MIADAIRQAQRMHRAAIEQTYDGVCNIYQQVPYKDPETKATSHKEVSLLTEQPCHLSFSGSPAVSDGGTAAAVTQTIKLFLAPEIEVRPGSRIEVTQQGRTESYNQSGKPQVYSSHQEIALELWEGYA